MTDLVLLKTLEASTYSLAGNPTRVGNPALMGLLAAQRYVFAGNLSRSADHQLLPTLAMSYGLAGDLIRTAGTITTAMMIPDVTRWTTWNPGDVIVNRTTIGQTVDVATYGDGVLDATMHIQSKIDTTPVGQVCFIPAGRYRITTRLVLDRSITLRGVAPGPGTNGISTQLRGVGVGAWVEILRLAPVQFPSYSGATNVTASVSKGSTSLTVASAAGFSVGDIITLDMDDPSYVHSGLTYFIRPEYGPATPGGRYRRVGQKNEIVAINGTTFTMRDPWHVAYPAASLPQIFKCAQGSLSQAGVEDMTITGGRGGQIQMWDANRCWVKHVETDGTVATPTNGNEAGTGNGNEGEHILLQGTYRCTIRDSYIHHSTAVMTGGGAYGISTTRHTSASLIENNIVYWMNKPYTERASGGGNVIGYNYFENAWIYNPYQYIQETTLDAGHGSFSHMDLFEGNWAAQFATETVWGNAGWMTAYRNRFSGMQQRTIANEYDEIAAVHMEWKSHNMNVLGCVLGQVGIVSQDNQTMTYEITANPPGHWSPAVWRLGCSLNVLGDGGGNEDAYENPANADSVRTMLYRHGNYDYVTNTVVWDANNSFHQLADSLYLSGKPAFFGSYTWPWVDALGATKVYTLPAKARFDAGTPNNP